jgi:hypothetical protein
LFISIILGLGLLPFIGGPEYLARFILLFQPSTTQTRFLIAKMAIKKGIPQRAEPRMISFIQEGRWTQTINFSLPPILHNNLILKKIIPNCFIKKGFADYWNEKGMNLKPE